MEVILATMLQAPNTVELNMTGKNSEVTKKQRLNALEIPDLVNNMQTTIAQVFSGFKKIRPMPKKPPAAKDQNKVILEPKDLAMKPDETIMMISARPAKTMFR